MQRDEPGSWRFEQADMDLLHHALFVRDAAKLPVASSPAVPPPLLGEAPEGPANLSDTDRGVAASDWLVWWRQMLDQAVREIRIRRAEDPAQDALTRALARFAGRQEICAPPDFAGLARMPELQSAAVATLTGYEAWRASRSARSEPQRSGLHGS